MGELPGRGLVGSCMREMLAYPVAPTSTCSVYHPRGVPYAARRVVRERRSHSSPRPAGSPPPAPLPSEIDLDMDMDTFRAVLTEVLRDELGIGDAEIGGRWQGGEVILKPGKDGTAEKRIPIDSLFHKVVMIRDKLRVLEQKINAHGGLTAEDKVALQQYITGCYGSLTTFNVLFADSKNDGFKGAGGKDE
jgi:hypothetical protein